jgi:hypothetical protein
MVSAKVSQETTSAKRQEDSGSACLGSNPSSPVIAKAAVTKSYGGLLLCHVSGSGEKSLFCHCFKNLPSLDRDGRGEPNEKVPGIPGASSAKNSDRTVTVTCAFTARR